MYLKVTLFDLITILFIDDFEHDTFNQSALTFCSVRSQIVFICVNTGIAK